MAKHFQVDTGGTLTTGLVSYYPMQGNSNDFYGSNNGADTSMTYGTSYAKIGEAPIWNGSSSSIAIPNTSALGQSTMTYAFWYKAAKLSGSGNGAGIIGNEASVNNDGVNIYQYNNNITFILFSSAGQSVNYVIPDTNYHFFVFMFAPSSVATLYVDGSLYGTSSNTASASYSPGTLNIGKSIDTYWEHMYSGTGFDELGIWDKNLSSTEISDLYNGGSGQTMVSSSAFTRTQSDAIMNGASPQRLTAITYAQTLARALSAAIMNAASRFAALAYVQTLSRSLSETMMNAASRFAVVGRGIERVLSDSMMNAKSLLATVAFGMGKARALSDSIMNSASRLATVASIKSILRSLSDSMMNAASRLAVLTRGASTFARGLSVNMMYAANRLTTFLATVPGKWAFRIKNATTWAFREKNSASWTFRNKNSPGQEEFTSTPN